MDFVSTFEDRSSFSFLTVYFLQFGEEDDMGPGGPAGLFAQFAQYGVTCAPHTGSA